LKNAGVPALVGSLEFAVRVRHAPTPHRASGSRR